jgi:hypothetical protein
VSARVWEKNGIAFRQEKLGISGHAFAIVPNAMQQQNGISIEGRRLCIPATKNCSVACGDTYVFEVGPETHFVLPMNLALVPHWAAWHM